MAFSTFNGINVKTYTDALNNVLESAKWHGQAKSQYNAKYTLINNKLDNLKSNVLKANNVVKYLNEALEQKEIMDFHNSELKNASPGVLESSHDAGAKNAKVEMNKAIANAKSELESMKTTS